MGMIHNSSKQSGFTLVEISLVMIGIGILISIVIGGARIRENAQVADIIKSLVLYESSAIKFKEIYGELPGDLRDPQARLTNCNAVPCTRAGNGDGALDSTTLWNQGIVNTDERFVFWNHLLLSGLISGFKGNDIVGFGEGQPAADVGGGYLIYYLAGLTYFNFGYNIEKSRHVISLSNAPDAAGMIMTGFNHQLRVSMAEKIDKKMDDGLASYGRIQCRAYGLGCSSIATISSSVYNQPDNKGIIGYLTKF